MTPTGKFIAFFVCFFFFLIWKDALGCFNEFTVKVSNFVFSASGDIETSMVFNCILSMFVFLDIFSSALGCKVPAGREIWCFLWTFSSSFFFFLTFLTSPLL